MANLIMILFGYGKENVNSTQNRGINKPWSEAGYGKTRIIYEVNFMQLSHINVYIISIIALVSFIC